MFRTPSLLDTRPGPAGLPLTLRVGLGITLAFTLAGGSGCRTYAERLADFRYDYNSARFQAAEAELDAIIADASSLPAEEIGSGTAPELYPPEGDLVLLLLEKAMVRLARKEPADTVTILRRCRDELDERFVNSVAVLGEQLLSSLGDDRALRYPGRDYEHILVRTLLVVADLLAGGGDAYAYAVQIGEKQEEIIGSEFGAVEGDSGGYQPRQRYRRVAIGAYLQGVIREGSLDLDEACHAYRRATEYDPHNPLLEAARERTCGGGRSHAPGHGVLHVLHLAGPGPYLVEGRAEVTDQALLLAGLLLAFIGRDPSLLFQAPVRVPYVAGAPPAPLLRVNAAGNEAITEPILDVHRVAREQLDANMPWILARAVVRRAIKGTGAYVARRGVEHATDSEGAGLVAGILVNLITTATERADTRCWSSLPGEFRAARLELPAGIHEVTLSNGQHVRLRIAAGFPSYLVIVQPDPFAPAVLQVDAGSVPPVEHTGPPTP